MSVAVFGFAFEESARIPETPKLLILLMNSWSTASNLFIDPKADTEEARTLNGVEFVDINTIKDMDAIILAVAHTEFSHYTTDQMDKFFGMGKKVLLALKKILNRKEYEAAGYSY